MPLGRNPFIDPQDVGTPDDRVPTTPRVRVTEINEANVVLAIEMVDDSGYPVLTLNRVCLRVGDAFPLASMSINLQVSTKEFQ